MFYTLPDLLALLVVIAGIALQTIVGIGFGLLAAPLLYLIDPAFVPGPILLLAGLLSLLVVLKQHQQLSWRRIMPAILARIPGAWFGALLLVSAPAPLLGLLFGSVLLLAVLCTWRRFELPLNRTSLTIGGFISGLIGTATSVGGPPIAMLYMNSDRLTARNEIAAFFLIGTPLSLLMLGLEGGFGFSQLALSLKMLPGLAIGWALGTQLDSRIDARSAKPAILLISLLSALMVLWDALSSLL
ncbi:sulfite exporter TauE/SafE family protein [Marinobacterium sp. CAU 1594]|nr:sulfite exporter TauE/SafE family protein [Marinobacterium arenosum]